jgi:hypothetical protein
VVLMIQVHVFDSYLKPEFRDSQWYQLSQFLGGLAAPLFLFMAGISIALVFDRGGPLLSKAIKRAGWILVLAYAFRVEQVVTWYPYAEWSDISKVDILNCIAVSSLLAGIAAAFTTNRKRNAVVLAMAGSAIVLVAPIVAPVRSGLPSILLAYINGNGRQDFFTVFPWAGYTFAGAAAGYLLLEARKAEREYAFMLCSAALGTVLFAVGYEVNRHPGLMPGLASYTRPSPHYVFQKLGYIFILLYMAYRWSGLAREHRWSPILLFGQTSLLIYWLHIEFVYGRARVFYNSLNVALTAAQLLWLIPLMVWIASVRIRWKESRQ